MIRSAAQPSDVARERMLQNNRRPLFHAAWRRTVMIHYAMQPGALQPLVPFELDTREGQAFVSLVMFTMHGLKPCRGGRLAAMLTATVATHGFLNVRTYVRCGGETGIYFLAEWLPNALGVRLGPPLFGLPYRHGELDYRHHHEDGALRGHVKTAGDGRLCYDAAIDPGADFQPCPPQSLGEFLLERYTAWTQFGRLRRLFRVWHPPWRQTPIHPIIHNASLLARTGDWLAHAHFAGAHYCQDLEQVWIGPPRWA